MLTALPSSRPPLPRSPDIARQVSLADLAEAATDLADFTVHVSPTQTIDAVPEDPDDNRVLECAMEAKSQCIVTGDAALLRFGQYGGIQIVRVAYFMALLV